MNKVYVETKNVRFPVAEDLYGLFFEDINRAGDGGLYPEMIRNRSFEDSLIPAGCRTDEKELVYINRGGWPGAFNHGEGMDDWAASVLYTPIPGWYSSRADMELYAEDTLNKNRERSLKVTYQENGKIWNIGYAGVPIKPQTCYKLYVFLKTETPFTLTAALEGKEGEIYGSQSILIKAEQTWQRADFELTADAEDFSGRVSLSSDTSCTVLYGFTSLMPSETYMGHGLRKDLVEMLKNTHPRFLRFPGGCIVEGLSEETAMRFSNTIGPVWERPSHSLMWHYRTTNGLGFHEYMQLCEDLHMEALYVCNCGISCQARVGEYFEEDIVDEFLQEAFHALEYALGSADTKYGAMRAAAGHPEPFSLKYMEIGNENWGPEYNKRYEKFYKALKEAYPDVIFISNSHTERDGLPTEFVDEHYYNAPEFFLENDTRFDTYDRKGPDIFLGEYAVNGGNTIASMECAMAEAVFLAGVERNQDIVKLSAYAPLFQNADYTAWKPNLIVFDNHQVYGIPSYYAISMMAGNRGKYIVESRTEVEQKPPVYKGIPGILCNQPGLQFKNVKINGKEAPISKTIYGSWKEQDGIYTMEQMDRPHPFTGKGETWNHEFEHFIRGHRHPLAPDESRLMWVVFGEEDLEEYTFEADLKFERENDITLSVWNFHPDTEAGCSEPKDMDWNLHSVRNQIWKISNGAGTTQVLGIFDDPKKMKPPVPLEIDYNKFNTYKITADKYGYKCYINNILVQQKELTCHNTVYAVASVEEDTVILKLIHVGKEEKEIDISLDCEVLPEIKCEVLSAEPDAVNSMEDKLHVAPVKHILDNGAQNFSYTLPPYSVNILRIRKKKDRSYFKMQCE